MKIKTWNIEATTGYTPKTTYYEDFSIADAFGVSAIKDTFRRAFKGAKDFGYIYLTEFVMALNWKIWEHCETNRKYAELYNDLWEKAREYVETNLQGYELMYYYHTTD